MKWLKRVFNLPVILWLATIRMNHIRMVEEANARLYTACELGAPDEVIKVTRKELEIECLKLENIDNRLDKLWKA